MADNTLNLDDVIKSDVFIKKLDETIAKIKELQSTIKTSNEMKLTIKGLQDFATSKTSGKDYEKFINEVMPKATELQEKLNKLHRIENETAGQRKQRQEEITKAYQNHFKEMEKVEKEQKKINENLKLEGKSIEELQKKTNALVTVRNKLNLQTEAGRKQYEQLTKQIATNTEQLKQYDAEIGRHQRNVGNYQSALIGLNSAFTKITLIGGAVIGFFKGIGSAISGIMAFEKQVSNLSAITGITGGDLKQLSNEAINMSRQFGFSAVGVVEGMKLIVGNMPKLAQSKEELKAVTEQVLLLSQASGMDVPEAAKRLTDALNQFNLPAARAGEAVDILAAGAKFGAAEIPDITDALLQFGTVAKNSNVNLNESVALIELLGEKGKKGSDAGVGLRNIITIMDAIKTSSTESQFALKNAGVNMDIVADTARPLSERLKELSKIQNDATAKVKVFGKENLTVGSIILESIPRFQELTGLVSQTGSAMEQAKINTDNLAGDLAVMGTAWDKLILSLNSGNSVISSIARGFVQMTTAIIDFFSGVEENSELLIEEQTNLNGLVESIGLYEAGSRERNALIEEINRKYPEFLKNMDLENISMEELNKRLKEYNQNQSQRINEALESETKKAADERINKLMQENDELLKQDAFYRSLQDKKRKGIATTLEEIQVSHQELLGFAARKKLMQGNTLEIERIRKETDETIKSIRSLTDETGQNFSRASHFRNVISKQNKETSEEVKNVASEGKKAIENEAKEREKAFKQLENLEKLKLELLKDSREKDLENQRIINEQRLREFKDMPDATPILQEINRAKIEEINKKWDEIELTNVYEIERAKADLLENNTELLFKIQLDYEKRKLSLMEEGSKEAQLQQSKIEKLQKDNYEKSFFGQYDALKKNFENQRTFAEIEIQDAEELSKKKLEIALEEAKAKLELFKKIAAADGEITDLEKEHLQTLSEEVDKFQKKIKEITGKEAILKATSDLSGALNDNVQVFNDYKQNIIDGLNEEVSASDNNLEKAKEYLQKQKDLREQGLAADIAGAQKQVAIEQEKNEKLKAERDKQIKQQQTAAKIQLAIQSAEQISNIITSSTQIYKTYSSIPGGTGIAIGLIALMISAFLAQKALAIKAVNQGQKFEKGGWIEGESHKNGGVPIEAEGGEFIISKKYASKNAEILEAINSGKLIEPLKNTNIVTVNNDFSEIKKEQAQTNVNLKKLLYLQRKSRFLTKNGYMDIEGNKVNFI